jgi:hypothetical protein
VGEAVSLAGTVLEGGVDFFAGDPYDGIQKAGFFVAGEVLDKVIDLGIPGPTPTSGLSQNAYEVGKRIKQDSEEAGNAIYKQMAGIKATIVEKTVETVQEKKKK